MLLFIGKIPTECLVKDGAVSKQASRPMLALVSLLHLQEPFKENDTSSWWCCYQVRACKRDGMKCGIWWIGPSKTVATSDFYDITQ